MSCPVSADLHDVAAGLRAAPASGAVAALIVERPPAVRVGADPDAICLIRDESGEGERDPARGVGEFVVDLDVEVDGAVGSAQPAV